MSELAKPGWTLTFGDEFNGVELDRKKWSTIYGSGGNGELQHYAPDVFSINGSILRITAIKKEQLGKLYTSGIIHTMESFAQRYGWFECRCKVPRGKGYWSAGWMLTTDFRLRPQEIDVFEILGDDERISVVNMYNHWREKGKAGGKLDIGKPLSEDYHTYAVEWTPDHIVWYFDGEECFRSTEGIPQVPMFVLVNLAVGGDWPGSPDATTPWPGILRVDYVRVYQKLADSPLRFEGKAK